jgi:hypothetical protein
MAKMTCAGGCGKVRDLEVAQKGAKDVSYTVSPKFWLCEDCKARQVPPTAVESRPQPIPQAVDPNVAFTFMPRPEPKDPKPEPKPAKEPAPEAPAKAETKDPEAAETEDAKA